MEPTRKQQLFAKGARTTPSAGDQVAVVMKQKIDPATRRPLGLTQDQKMLCALRKILTKLSDDSQDHQRYYIAGDTVEVLGREAFPGAREKDPGHYKARGRFQLGVINPGRNGVVYKRASFNLHFHDTKDDLGLRDVEYDEDSTIDIDAGVTSPQ